MALLRAGSWRMRGGSARKLTAAPLFRRMRLRPGVGRFLRQPYEDAVRRHVGRPPGCRVRGCATDARDAKASAMAASGSASGSLMSMPDFRCKFHRRWPTRTPASTRGFSSARALSKSDELTDTLIGAFADDEGQIDVAAVVHLVDRRAVGGDGADLAVLLPDAVGRALDDVDDDLVWIKLAHARLLDERIGLEPRPGGGDVEEQKRAFRADAGERQDPRFAEMGCARHGHHFDAEADLARR